MSTQIDETSSFQTDQQQGYKYAFLAYSVWGLFPIYWKLLGHVFALEVLFHRVLWSALFYGLLILVKFRSRLPRFDALRALKIPLLLASLLIGINWGMYIYAVQVGLVLDASLGYFINPLLNVALGVMVFKEKLSKPKRYAFALALLGVLTITVEAGHFPWIAFILGGSFALYGVAKKKINLPSLHSGLMESLILLPLLLVVFAALPDHSLTLNFDHKTWLLLIGAGVVTGTPLLWFSEAARRIPYSTLGFFQYIAPTFQFLTGVFLFHESLTPLKLFGFAMIWIGLLFLMLSNLRRFHINR